MLHTEAIADGLRLILSDELTIYKVGELKAPLMAAITQSVDIEFDLADVREMDSAGVQLLIALKKQAISCGSTLRLTGHSNAVLQLFELYNLAAYFGDPLFIGTPEKQDFISAGGEP